jgi:hypothetical protein
MEKKGGGENGGESDDRTKSLCLDGGLRVGPPDIPSLFADLVR